MTPNQQERWQSIAMPVAIGVLDGYEATDAALAETIKRYQKLNVPGWVLQTRLDLVRQLRDAESVFLPEFIVRAELAIVGMQLMYYRNRPGLVDAHKRLHLAFCREALKPVVVQVSRTRTDRKVAYGPLLKVAKLLKNPKRFEDFYWNRKENEDTWDFALVEEEFNRSSEVWNKYFRLHAHWSRHPENEISDVKDLAASICKEVAEVQFGSPGSWWKSAWVIAPEKPKVPRGSPWGRLMTVRIIGQYAWLTRKWPDGKPQWPDLLPCREQLARVFLAALESECPSPAWMQHS